MYPPTKSKTRSASDLLNGTYAMFIYVFILFFFYIIFFLKAYVVGTHLNCIDKSMQQMGTHNISLYKDVDKKNTLAVI